MQVDIADANAELHRLVAATRTTAQAVLPLPLPGGGKLPQSEYLQRT